MYNKYGDNMKALVLSGGGSKGAYQIGVWKALKKLHMKFDIVTGTSVGALNAALVTQNTYYKAVRLWKNISFSKVLDGNIDDNKVVRSYAKKILNGGADITNLERTVSEALNLKKLYNSKKNMGIITYNLKKMKPLILTKDKIPKDKMKDYLIASASCFPAFKKKTIDNSSYIDGGFYDNLPINLAIDMGADEVVAVDLKEIGLKQKVKDKKVKITTISPRNDIGSFLVFNSNNARRAIRLGYNDTLKKYGMLDGIKYTFKKDSLKKNYDRYKVPFKYNEYIEIIEKIGYMFDIDDSYIYDIRVFNKKIIDKFVRLKGDKALASTKVERIKKLFNKKYIVKYLYNNPNNRELKKLFKDEYQCSIYIKNILEVK